MATQDGGRGRKSESYDGKTLITSGLGNTRSISDGEYGTTTGDVGDGVVELEVAET